MKKLYYYALMIKDKKDFFPVLDFETGKLSIYGFKKEADQAMIKARSYYKKSVFKVKKIEVIF